MHKIHNNIAYVIGPFGLIFLFPKTVKLHLVWQSIQEPQRTQEQEIRVSQWLVFFQL